MGNDIERGPTNLMFWNRGLRVIGQWIGLGSLLEGG